MKYYTEKHEVVGDLRANTYSCNHPLYDKCTLYLDGSKGLAIVQQRFNKRTKSFYYSPIDIWLINDIYNNPLWQDYFDEHAGVMQNDIYPTVHLRSCMYALKMKPLRKEEWERDLNSSYNRAN